MPPKKREKDPDSMKNPRIDHIQADHELFLQAFEKPTQIYRYLRTRHMCSPIFLNRTLTYMKDRMSRSHKGRQNFKVDSLLEKVMNKHKSLEYNPQTAQVETKLLKISHKKRKDSSTLSTQETLGIVDIPVNPKEQELPLTAPTISVHTEMFDNSTSPLVTSYSFLFSVKIPLDRESDNDEPAVKKRKSNIETNYYSELVVFDKHNRCQISNADYAVVMQDFTVSASPKKYLNWEDINDLGRTPETLDSYMKDATLKFNLRWSQEASAAIVDRPKPYPLLDNKENLSLMINGNNNNNNVEKLQIIYQFVYNNNSRQQTEACEDFNCPWCGLNCHQLYTLLKHLKLCHSRFTFTYVPTSKGARIDITINEMYDGSYTGSPHDLVSQPTVCAFSRNRKVRRASVTHILVCHPKRPKPSLSEFLELDDCEFDGQRPFITGHNRLYHHTTTCLPIYPKEMDVDSEGENDPEWLQNKTMMMIDEFTDVNEGEKELMKMWNLHVMKFGFVGNCQIQLACQMFVEHRGQELLMKNLYRNFVLHLCSLFDFGLVSAVCLYTIIQKLQSLVDTGPIRNVLKESREAQMDSWSKNVHLPFGLNLTKTPIRKSGNVGNQRRKGTPTPNDISARRKSTCAETARKRLSLGKSDQKSS